MLSHIHNIGICGLGVIGGSCLLAATHSKDTNASDSFLQKINAFYGFDSNIYLQEALQQEWLSRYLSFPNTFENLIASVDVLIVAVPPRTTGEVIEAAIKIKPDLLIIELASVKNHLLHYSEQHRVIHLHPMAGGNQANAKLFQGQTIVVLKNDSRLKFDRRYEADLLYACALFKAITGQSCQFKTITDSYHDKYMAEISHLPQILSHIVAQQLTRANASVVGTGFRTITKVTQDNPVLWTDILLENKENVKEQINLARQELAVLQEALELDNASAIERWFKTGPRRLNNFPNWSQNP